MLEISLLNNIQVLHNQNMSVVEVRDARPCPSPVHIDGEATLITPHVVESHLELNTGFTDVIGMIQLLFKCSYTFQ